jgi:Zn-dependent protease
MDLTGGSFRLFRIAGIDVYLHWSWFLVAVLQITYRPAFYDAAAWKVVEYLSLFAIVLLHEFGHAFACRSVGGRADQIVLWPLGGVAYVAPPARPGAVLWSIAAGPLVNLVLMFPIGLGFLLAWSGGLEQTSPDLYRFLLMLTTGNAILFFFNLLPIYPLDGGQIVQALLWFAIGRWASLQVVSLLGILFAGVLFMGGLILFNAGGWMLCIIAFFIAFRSLVSFQQSRAVLFLRSLPRHDECECPSCGMHPPKGPFWVCEHCRTRFDLFDSRGQCPACGAWYLEPDCPHCRRGNHIDKWFPAPVPPDESASGSLSAPPASPPS